VSTFLVAVLMDLCKTFSEHLHQTVN
jgi:hypothetical protein